MPTFAPSDEFLLGEALYPIKQFMRIAGISQTTLWRAETKDGVKLPRIRSGGKTYVEGHDGIAWIKERARVVAERKAKAATSSQKPGEADSGDQTLEA